MLIYELECGQLQSEWDLQSSKYNMYYLEVE